MFLQEAYGTIGDIDKRAAYDSQVADSVSTQHTASTMTSNGSAQSSGNNMPGYVYNQQPTYATQSKPPGFYQDPHRVFEEFLASNP